MTQKQYNFRGEAIEQNILRDIAKEKYGLELYQYMRMLIKNTINAELIADEGIKQLIEKRMSRGKYKD